MQFWVISIINHRRFQMKPLEILQGSIQAEVAVSEIIGDILRRVGDGIQNKIVMQMVPQYSIENINRISSNVLDCFRSRHETLHADIYSPIQEPKPIYFDKRMQRTCPWTLLNKTSAPGSVHESTKSTLWKSKLPTQDYSKSSGFKQLESLKQDSSMSCLQLNFLSLHPSSEIQNSLRRRKEEEERRKQKNDSREEIEHTPKSIPTSREMGALLQLKKDYTYDYNGGVIPVNRVEKIFYPKVDVSYDVSDKLKEKIAQSVARKSKLRSKLKKTELKLQESPSCFFDNKSPFYKNFEAQRKNIESRQKEVPDKVYSGELPNYMRILTQEGGIKKRYARYNEKGEMTNNSSLLRQRLRENSVQSQARNRLSTKQNQRPTLSKLILNSSEHSEPFHSPVMKLPQTDRIKILNQKLRQKVIQPQIRSQTESDLLEIVNMSSSQIISLGGRNSKNRLPGIKVENNL